MYVEASAPFEAVYAHGGAGLVGTIEVVILDNDGNIVTGPTTTNITEDIVSGSPIGIYTWNAPAAPAPLGQYTIVWSPDGTWDAETNSTPDELVVVAIGSSGTLPPLPVPEDGGLAVGPCSAWTTSLAIAQCTGEVNSNVFDDPIHAASELLYELSGRLFSGICQRTVRPCGNVVDCGFQILSRGHIVGWSGTNWGGDARPCGCRALDRVLLSGYPVREVTEVKIDGVVVDPTTYRLDEHRWLTRVRDPLEPDQVLLWPSCQHLDLDDDEEGTFSVTYTYGQSPPMLGVLAATHLAHEMYRACSGGECALPTGVTRINRQGIVIERLAFATWAFRDGRWSTGIPLVDAFLSGYNPTGRTRRPTVWSPSTRMRYARPVGS